MPIETLVQLQTILAPWLIVASLLMLGYIVRHILQRFFSVVIPSVVAPEGFLQTVVLGSSLLVLLTLPLSLMRRLDTLGVQLLTIIAAVSFTFLASRRLKAERSFDLTTILTNLGQTSSLFFIQLIIYGFSFLNLPTVPGGDARSFAFVAWRIYSSGAITFDPGYQVYLPSFHFSLFSFPAMNSFFSLLTNTDLAKVQLYLYVFFFMLWPFAAYALTKHFTRNATISYVSALLQIFAARSVYGYLTYGGVGESLGIILALGLLSLLAGISFNSRLHPSRPKLFALFVTLLMIPLIFTHYTAFLLFLMILSGVTVWSLTRKERPILVFAIPLAIMIAVGITVYLVFSNTFTSQIEIIYANPYRGSEAASWEYQLVYLKQYQSLTDFGNHCVVVTQSLFGLGLGILALAGVVYSLTKPINRIIRGFLLGFFLYFLLSQNSPYGLYFISHMASYQMSPVRLLEPVSPILIMFGSMILTPIFPHRLTMPRISLRACRKIISQIQVASLKNRLIVLLLLTMALVSFSVIPYEFCNTFLGFRDMALRNSNVSREDVKAYKWIMENTESDAVFLSLATDGSTWIPMYTSRIIVPSISVRQWTNWPANPNYRKLDELYIKFKSVNVLNSSTFPLILEMFKLLGVDRGYVYIGVRAQYDDKPPRLIGNLPYSIIVYKARVIILRVDVKNCTLV